MKKRLSIISAVAILVLNSAAVVYAHGGIETSVPALGHGSQQDKNDHSQIKVLDISAEEAITALETGLSALAEQIEAGDAEAVMMGALALMAAVKTLKEKNPSERQAAALRQLDQQLDGAKHAAEDGEFDKAKPYLTRAQSALQLYKAVR